MTFVVDEEVCKAADDDCRGVVISATGRDRSGWVRVNFCGHGEEDIRASELRALGPLLALSEQEKAALVSPPVDTRATPATELTEELPRGEIGNREEAIALSRELANFTLSKGGDGSVQLRVEEIPSGRVDEIHRRLDTPRLAGWRDEAGTLARHEGLGRDRAAASGVGAFLGVAFDQADIAFSSDALRTFGAESATPAWTVCELPNAVAVRGAAAAPPRIVRAALAAPPRPRTCSSTRSSKTSLSLSALSSGASPTTASWWPRRDPSRACVSLQSRSASRRAT